MVRMRAALTGQQAEEDATLAWALHWDPVLWETAVVLAFDALQAAVWSLLQSGPPAKTAGTAAKAATVRHRTSFFIFLFGSLLGPVKISATGYRFLTLPR